MAIAINPDWLRWAREAASVNGTRGDWVFAIGMLESNWGRSWLVPEKNNYHGIRDKKGKGFRVFERPFESFLECARLLGRSKLYAGCKTLEEIGAIYCAADPDWAAKVQKIIDTVDPNSIIISGNQMIRRRGVEQHD